MRRGEVWWVNLPTPFASEPGYRRPMVVIQANSYNSSHLSTVVCVAISSNLALSKLPGNVYVGTLETGLPKDSVVNVTQIATADRSFFDGIVGRLPDALMQQIEVGLRQVLSL